MRAPFPLALLLLPALAAAAGNAPRLERLQIDIWPEYDRPAVLVILKGELAGNAGSPTPLALRIPASSGGPSALAYSTQETGPLLNLPHERSTAADFITLRFTVPARFFHVEFYEPLDTRGATRSYRYQWPGDLPVEKLRVTVQEPAAASGMTVQPDLGQSTVGSDSLRYRSAELGPVPPGKPLSFEVRYAKSDPRNTAEILKGGSSPATGTSQEERASFRVFVASSAFALLLAGSALVYFVWRRRRQRVTSTAETGVGHCAKCGHRPSAGDRYCARCGAAL
jgi:hypothetical protein